RLPGDIESLLDRAVHRLLKENLRCAPGALPLVQALYQRDIPMAVASNSSYSSVEAMLGHTGMQRYFGGRIATRDQVKAPKPAPDVYLLAATALAATALAARPADCLAIEDSPAGITAARAAGMSVVGYCPCAQADAADDLLRAGASFVIQDLQAL